MTKAQEVVIALINSEVTQNTPQIPTNINWEEVLGVATSQGVFGLCADALQRLPREQRPGKSLLMKWIGQVGFMENCYQKHEELIKKLARFYADNGIRLMILKGYGLSHLWPNPKHRPVGDIDTYNFGSHVLADRIMHEKLGIPIENNHHKHSVFSICGVTVENHYSFLNVHGHRSTAEIEDILEEAVAGECVKDKELQNVYYPSMRFNSLYLLRHSAEHFASVQINLRQVLDWGFFVRANDMDWDWLFCQLGNVGMKQYLAILNAICVKHLGFDATLFPVMEVDDNLVERSFNDILIPEFQKETHKNALAEIAYRFKRWNANRWKHDIVYKESMWQSLCTQIWSHILKPSL